MTRYDYVDQVVFGTLKPNTTWKFVSDVYFNMYRKKCCKVKCQVCGHIATYRVSVLFKKEFICPCQRTKSIISDPLDYNAMKQEGMINDACEKIELREPSKSANDGARHNVDDNVGTL